MYEGINLFFLKNLLKTIWNIVRKLDFFLRNHSSKRAENNPKEYIGCIHKSPTTDRVENNPKEYTRCVHELHNLSELDFLLFF